MPETDRMNCPNCGEPIEVGVSFCGNCGQALQPMPSAVPSAIAQVIANQPPATSQVSSFNTPALNLASNGLGNVPAYALARNHPHVHLKIVLSLAFGVIGIFGSFFYPIIGVALGSTGIVLASMSPAIVGKALKITAFVLASLALLIGLAVWVFVATHDPKLRKDLGAKSAPVSTGSASVALSLTTPCYSLGFSKALNISNQKGSCSMEAYNGTTLDNSSEVYKVLTSAAPNLTASNFNTVSKQAIESDVTSTLPGFTIENEQSGEFAGSPAYFVKARSSKQDVIVEEASVFHATPTGDNFFILVHAVNGTSIDVSALEAQWQWK